MKLVVGLGNPGKRYDHTRHNVGFIVVDALANELSFDDWKLSKKAHAYYTSRNIHNKNIELLKPQTFMNDSGRAVKYARDKHSVSPEEIFVLFDDLDISIGEYKIQQGKGPKDHNGLNSVYEKLGTNDFWHVRIGIDNPETRTVEGTKLPGERYVLMKFTDDEEAVLETVYGDVVAELSSILQRKD